MKTKKERSETVKSIISQLKEKRQQKGLSRIRLAALTGLDKGTIYNVEQTTKDTGIETIVTICEALDSKIKIVSK